MFVLKMASRDDRTEGGAASLPTATTNRCWGNMGSVDVEDLAIMFGENRYNNDHYVGKTYANPNHRVFRNRSVTSTITATSTSQSNGDCYVRRYDDSSIAENYYNGCDYENRCNGNCSENGFSRERLGAVYGQRYSMDNRGFGSGDRGFDGELGFDHGLPCTEDQWLACPATVCPLYGSVGNNAVDNAIWTNDSNNRNLWNLHDDGLNLGPSLPPCMLDQINSYVQPRDNFISGCYFRNEEEQQFFEEYLSNEKRKEKSRDAARCRRSKETDIFTELAGALPLEPDQAAQLDKASVMRLAIAYLKVRSVIDSLEEPSTKTERMGEMDASFPQALDGFLLVISSNGDMVYLSENVSDYLGVSQMDMMGQSIYEYSHPCDHDELRECLSLKPIDVKDKRPCNFFLRLKCTLTSKGRKVNLKSASYKVIHCVGRAMGNFETNTDQQLSVESEHIRDGDSSDGQSIDDRDSDSGYGAAGFGYCGASIVVVGCPVPHPSNIEVPLGRHTFLSKHSLNMKFTYADDRLAEYLGWTSDELLGKSVFEFHHALDNSSLDKSFKLLFSKGQCETTAYRFLGRKGGYAWVVTQATLIHCSKQHKPLSVVCVNHILSGIECENEIYSGRQLKARKAESLNDDRTIVRTDENCDDDSSEIFDLLPQLISETPSPSAAEDSVDDDEDIQSRRTNVNPTRTNRDASPLTDSNLKFERVRPQSVTASLFRTHPDLVNQNLRREQQSSNPKIDKNSEIRRERSSWFFQDKPILDYEPPRTTFPQAVTRSLFVPLSSIQATDNQQRSLYEQTVANRSVPQSATASIFAPRTEDMNKGFLTFSDDHPGLTMLKDEPEDLTHLAPTPGDVCVPLDDTPFLSDDMLDEFILANENYCPLLSPVGLSSNELPNSDLSDSLSRVNSEIGDSLGDGDPFMYRDIPGSASLSPNILSPDDATSGNRISMGMSPEQNSMDSSGSLKENSPVDGSMTIGNCPDVGNSITEDEMLMLSINDVIGDDELALRAPYIPMSDQDEALQMLISDDTVMWGPTQPVEKRTKWYGDEKSLSKRCDDSSLINLLKNDREPTKYNDRNGGLVDPVEIFGRIGKGKTEIEKRLDRPSKRFHNGTTGDSPSDVKRSRFQTIQDPMANTSRTTITDAPKNLQNIAKQFPARHYDERGDDPRNVSANVNVNVETSLRSQRGCGQLLMEQLMSRDNVQSKNGNNKFRDQTILKCLTKDCPDLFTIVDANVGITSSSTIERNGKSSGDGGGEESGEGGGGGGGGGPGEATGAGSGAGAGRRRRNEGGNDSSPSPNDHRQSNSVLMNLLVSGCDKASGLKTVHNVEKRWTSMFIDDTENLGTSKVSPRSSQVDEYTAVDPNVVSSRKNVSANYFDRCNASKGRSPMLPRMRITSVRKRCVT